MRNPQIPRQFIRPNPRRVKRWPLSALEMLLLSVSAWRTFDFIKTIMSAIPGAPYYALLSVLISEGAYLVWSKFAYPNADEGNQETVSIAMIAINTIGLLLLSFGENLIRAAAFFTWSEQASNILAFTPWAMLALNLVGVLLYGILDDDHIDAKTVAAQMRLDRNAKRDLEHAEKMGHIQAKLKAISLLDQNSEATARKLAPLYFQDIQNRVIEQTQTNLNKSNRPTPTPAPIPISEDFAALANQNGGNHSPKVKTR